MKMIRTCIGLLLFVFVTHGIAYTVKDDSGQTIKRDKPAQRVVTLAPFLTELLYSINAAETIVATVEHSNYPDKAQAIRRIGNYENINVEQVLALQPDIVLAWQSANHPQQLKQLEKLGIVVYRAEPARLEDVASTLRRLGDITGHTAEANRVATAFMDELAQMQQRFAQVQRITAFYQVWDEPIYTVNGQHIISSVMKICGVENVFADATLLAPVVSVEMVLKKNPQMIIASGMGEARPDWLSAWQRWPSLDAVKAGNLFFIHPDLIQRHTLRLLEATQLLCEQAQTARRNIERINQTQ